MTSASMSVTWRSTRGSGEHVAGPGRVAIALEPDARDGPDAIDGEHRRLGGGRDVDRLDTTDQRQ